MPISLQALPMTEALEYWKSKVQLTPKQFYALAESHRARAFTVSKLARASMVDEIFQALEKAMEEGTSFNAWQDAYSPIWKENGWTGQRAWRVDNIFRTNIQTAYNVGRYKQMMATTGARPYWQYSAVNDSRTRPTHRALHGRVYRWDSPFWSTWYPPNGFRCRCKVKTLSERQVAARGLTVSEGNGLGALIEPIGPNGPMPARPLMPDKGFEGNPGKEAWTPDLSKYPDILREKLEAQLVGVPDVAVVPINPPVSLVDAGRKIKETKTLTQESALELEQKFDAITGRKHSLGLKDDGLPQPIGAELNKHVGDVIIRLGRMSEKASAEGRTNPRSDAVLAAIQELIAKYL